MLCSWTERPPTPWSIMLTSPPPSKKKNLPARTLALNETGDKLDTKGFQWITFSPRWNGTWDFDFHPNQVNCSSPRRLTLFDISREKQREGKTSNMDYRKITMHRKNTSGKTSYSRSIWKCWDTIIYKKNMLFYSYRKTITDIVKYDIHQHSA